MSYTLHVYDVGSNHAKTKVWKGVDGWHVILWGSYATHSIFGRWEMAIKYATTGKIELRDGRLV